MPTQKRRRFEIRQRQKRRMENRKKTAKLEQLFNSFKNESTSFLAELLSLIKTAEENPELARTMAERSQIAQKWEGG